MMSLPPVWTSSGPAGRSFALVSLVEKDLESSEYCHYNDNLFGNRYTGAILQDFSHSWFFVVDGEDNIEPDGSRQVNSHYLIRHRIAWWQLLELDSSQYPIFRRMSLRCCSNRIRLDSTQSNSVCRIRSFNSIGTGSVLNGLGSLVWPCSIITFPTIH